MMRSVIARRRLGALAVLAVALTVVSPAGPRADVAAGDPSPSCSYCAGGEYHPITPTRILDTRDPSAINDPKSGAMPMSNAATPPSFVVQLLGLGDESFDNPWLPDTIAGSSDVLAVAVGITVVGPTASGYLEAYATGSRPAQRTSIVNYPAGQTVANMAVLRPSAAGEITVELVGNAASAEAHVLIDVFGWFSSSAFEVTDGTMPVGAHGGRLIAVEPGRIVDTRTSSPFAAPGSLTTRTVTIRGATTLGTSNVIVPDDPDVVGVLLNVTAVRPTATTFVSVLPEDPPPDTLPATSNLNATAGQVRAAMVMVPVGLDGKVRLFNGLGTTNLLVDVLGYIEKRPDDTRVGRVVPLTAPFRAFDTRQPAFGGVPLGPGQAEDWSFAAFTASVSIDGVPVGNQSALLGNLTNAKLSRQYLTVSVDPGYVTMYPTPPISNTPPPTISNLNSRESITGDSRAVPNMAVVKYGANSTVRVFNARGYAHYLFDVSAVVLAD